MAAHAIDDKEFAGGVEKDIFTYMRMKLHDVDILKAPQVREEGGTIVLMSICCLLFTLPTIPRPQAQVLHSKGLAPNRHQKGCKPLGCIIHDGSERFDIDD